MGYLKTLLTYNVPSEAEVDKAFLESHGIDACLLNANTSRNELGAPFFVRLQVMDTDLERAGGLIREANPSRFGSPARVDEIDRQIKRSLGRFFLIAVPVGVLVLGLTYLLVPQPANPFPMRVRRIWVFPNFRAEASICSGLAACVLSALWLGRPRK
jgi:hypothetical protein